MANEDYTHIHVLVDRSGSMQLIQSDVIGGFNSLLEKQKAEPGKCTMGYVQFDHEYDPRFKMKPINKVPNLNKDTFEPRGATALWDSWCRAMTDLQEQIISLPQEERPGKVVFVVITDGFENNSTQFKAKDVNLQVSVCKELGWHFTFIAANQDAIVEGAKYGVSKDSSLTFGTNSKGVEATYHTVTTGISRMRKGVTKSISYTDTEREESLGDLSEDFT